MNELLIKICGVRSPEIARVVAESGADLMGLIFAPVRRQVSEEQARQIVAGLESATRVSLSRPPCHPVPRRRISSPFPGRSALEDPREILRLRPQDANEAAHGDQRAAHGDELAAQGDEHRPKVVGVFVNETVDEMNRLAESVGLDFIQLSGDEPVEVQAALNRPVIRALRMPVGMTPAEAYEQAEQYLECRAPARALLLDTHVSGSYGGNGVPGDWNVARALAERYPVLLAGGLRPETVDDALRAVRPLGVDVSSGVETDGVKDPEKIKQFIAAARAAAVPAGRSDQ
jgi:phosphoribosylanthranilate isomerase